MDEILPLSEKLIAVPSTKDNPEDLQTVLQITRDELQEFTCEAFVKDSIPSILFYTGNVRPDKFKVLLSAHVDVVPGKPEQFKAQVKNGKLYGRGAIDMKAAAAVEALVFKEVAPLVKYPLGLQLVTDEEIGGHKGVKYQADQGVLTDLYICGEYSFLDIGYQSKGVLWLKLISKGKRAHGAYPWNGENAITKLNRELLAINKLFKIPAKATWKTTCNIGAVSAGQAFNQVPDIATASLDIRRVPQDSTEAVISRIKANFVYSDTTLEIVADEPANSSDYNHPLVRQLAKSIKAHTRKPVKNIRFHGASDARHYSAKGAIAIDFGPSGEGLHSDIEWADIKSLQDYYQILKSFLLSL